MIRRWLLVLGAPFVALALGGCGTATPEAETGPPQGAGEQAQQPCEGANCRLKRLVREYEVAEQRTQPAVAWRRFDSASFRIIHRASDQLAARLAQQAEAWRLKQLAYWGSAATAPWSPRCEITLYDSYADLRLQTRGTTLYGSAQSRAAKLSRVGLLSRKIKLTRRDRHLLSRTLPHELSHVILQELLGNRRLPLWANEGMAVLWEGKRRIERAFSSLQPHLRQETFIPLATLLSAARYPDEPRRKALFYAQSAALIYFLFSIDRSRETLLAFLRQISPPSYAKQATVPLSTIEAALQQHYGLSDLAALTQRWRLRLDARLQPRR